MTQVSSCPPLWQFHIGQAPNGRKNLANWEQAMTNPMDKPRTTSYGSHKRTKLAHLNKREKQDEPTNQPTYIRYRLGPDCLDKNIHHLSRCRILKTKYEIFIRNSLAIGQYRSQLPKNIDKESQRKRTQSQIHEYKHTFIHAHTTRHTPQSKVEHKMFNYFSPKQSSTKTTKQKRRN